MYAIIQTGGKQFSVRNGDVIYIEKLEAEVGQTVDFDALMISREGEGEALIGTPTVAGAKIVGKVVSHGKGAKIHVYTYKSKKNERRRKGHRQPFTKVEICAIEA